jgi:hypothetical protein
MVFKFTAPYRPDQLQDQPSLLSLGIKLQGHIADHSPSTSAKVKKMWFYTTKHKKKIMFLGSKVRLVCGADNLTAIYEPIV